METTYRNYEPNKGLEEIQATLFNQATGRAVTAAEIKERFEREQIDPKTVIYAFSPKGTPLAYIQARDYPQLGQVHLGNPWAIPETPPTVISTLYESLFNYMKNRETPLKLVVNTNMDPSKIAFAERNGLVLDRRVVQFEFNLDSIEQYPFDSLSYNIRPAQEGDLDKMMECYCLAYSLPSDGNHARFRDFLTQGLKAGNLFVVMEGEKIVAVAGIRTPDDVSALTLTPQPIFTLLGKEDALPLIMRHSLQFAQENGWGATHISLGYTDENPQEMAILRQITKSEQVTNIRYIQP